MGPITSKLCGETEGCSDPWGTATVGARSVHTAVPVRYHAGETLSGDEAAERLASMNLPVIFPENCLYSRPTVNDSRRTHY
jgi:hypothetical protein